MNLTAATYKILYNNKNITADISQHLVSLSYTDKVTGEADEFEMQLEDADALWQNDWMPEKGATINAEIEDDGITLSCGDFAIDEPAFSFNRSGGDVIAIKCIAAAFTQTLRTKRHTAHENKTLREIAKTVADRHGFTLTGDIPNIPVGRISQSNEHDLEFLMRLANTYGLIFSIRGKQMVFTDITNLEKTGSVLTLKKSDCESISITDKSAQTFKNSTVKYHNPDDKNMVDYETADDANESADTLSIYTKAENKQQAERIATTNLYRANSFQKEGNITVSGNPLLVSGVNFSLIGCGKLSGIYHILESNHSITRGESYVTSISIKQVGAVDSSFYK